MVKGPVKARLAPEPGAARRARRGGAPEARYFVGPEPFRRWLEQHHAGERELLVGFHRRDSGVRSLTWQESVDEALCFGWIDGLRRRVDGARYTIRFTPRKAGSTWSALNIARAGVLARLGRMRPAGLRAFQARTDDRSATYSYEQRRAAALAPEQLARLESDRSAWEFWTAQPAGYRRVASHWVLSAKRPETREKRLETLRACSAGKLPIPPLRWAGKR